MGDIKYISIREFWEGGYLQEVNRRFLHPLGLALSVKHHDDGTITLGDIWDYRDDPEGLLFDTDVIDHTKVVRVSEEWDEKAEVRMSKHGFVIQPK